MKNILYFLVLLMLAVGLTGMAGCYDKGYKKDSETDEDLAEELDLGDELEDIEETDEIEKAVEEVTGGSEDKTAEEIIGKMREKTKAEEKEEGKEKAKVIGEETTEKEEAEPAETKAKGVNEVKILEGELLELKLQGKDPDGDPITYQFSKPLGANGKWQTKLGDEGTYSVDITATDSKGAKSVKTISVKILHKNRAPAIKDMNPILVNEGDVVRIKPVITDVEGDKVEVTFAGWMATDTYQTTYEDAGEHIVSITASDSELSTKKDVKVVVSDVNRAPEFEILLK